MEKYIKKVINMAVSEGDFTCSYRNKFGSIVTTKITLMPGNWRYKLKLYLNGNLCLEKTFDNDKALVAELRKGKHKQFLEEVEKWLNIA